MGGACTCIGDSEDSNTPQGPPTEKKPVNEDNPAEKANEESPAEKANEEPPAEKANEEPPAEKANEDPPAEKQNNEGEELAVVEANNEDGDAPKDE